MRPAWIFACVIGEALGISLVATVYAAVDRGMLPGAAVWILSAGAFEGLSLGVAQAAILRRAGVRPYAWVISTVFAAALGYGLSLLGGAGGGPNGGVNAEPQLGILVGLAAGMGLGMGALMGLSQWASAPRKFAAHRWIGANALAWTLAMIVIMLAASSAQGSWPLGGVALLGAGAGAGAGLLVGAVTSFSLPAIGRDE